MAVRRVWQDLRERWLSITNEEVDFPTTWASLLLSEVTHGRGRFGNRFDERRWRILFSEALWFIWLHRCAWSHGEIPTYDTDAVLAKYDSRITLRIQIDRQLALDNASDDSRQIFESTWRTQLSD